MNHHDTTYLTMYLRNTFYTADQHPIPLSMNNLPQLVAVVTHRQNEAREISPRHQLKHTYLRDTTMVLTHKDTTY